MIFSEHVFILLFLPVTLFMFHLCRSFRLYRGSAIVIVLSSFVFYGYWSLGFLMLLIVSMTINYVFGLYLYRAPIDRHSTRIMWVAILANLSLIFYFKYAGFVIVEVAGFKNFSDIFQGIILPIGISFFTFQQVAYVVDAHAKKTYEPDPLNYALFISFFPQLVSGPIVNHTYVKNQYKALIEGSINSAILRFGIILFSIGLIKKVLIADVLGRYVDPMFATVVDGGAVSASQSWLMVSAYRLQLYFDFSGYSDMALGVAAMFGLRLPMNFNSPYKATSIIDLWGRWHMTLSSFIRDYVYIPLGGNREGKFKQLRNIFIGMVLIGIWHGASWTFVVYAILMASAVCLNHAVRHWWPAFTDWNGPLVRALKWAMAICFFFATGAFFRAENMVQAMAIFRGLFGLGNGAALHFPALDPILLLLCAMAMAVVLLAPNSLQIVRYSYDLGKCWPIDAADPVTLKEVSKYTYTKPISNNLELLPYVAIACGLSIAVCIAAGWKPAIFIYFNF